MTESAPPENVTRLMAFHLRRLWWHSKVTGPGTADSLLPGPGMSMEPDRSVRDSAYA